MHGDGKRGVSSFQVPLEAFWSFGHAGLCVKCGSIYPPHSLSSHADSGLTPDLRPSAMVHQDGLESSKTPALLHVDGIDDDACSSAGWASSLRWEDDVCQIARALGSLRHHCGCRRHDHLHRLSWYLLEAGHIVDSPSFLSGPLWVQPIQELQAIGYHQGTPVPPSRTRGRSHGSLAV